MAVTGRESLCTTERSRVDVPEWAERFDRGDEITVQSDAMDEPVTVTVIGWSIHSEWEGCPVVSADELHAKGVPGPDVREVAIQEHNVVEVEP